MLPKADTQCHMPICKKNDWQLICHTVLSCTYVLTT